MITVGIINAIWMMGGEGIRRITNTVNKERYAMKIKKAKLFWKLGEKEKQIYSVSFDDNEEYYAFLKKCNLEGLRQIIISSELMITIIKKAVQEYGFSLYDIEFQEEDEHLLQEIKILLELIPSNKYLFVDLIEHLRFLSEKSSIDIKRIKIKGRDNSGVALNYYVQSNGVFGVTEGHYEEIKSKIISAVTGELF